MARKNEVKIGEFLVSRDKGNPFDRLKIETTSGNWNVKFRQDQEVFNTLVELSKDEEMSSYLETWIRMQYLVCMTAPDLDFMQDFFKAYTSLIERRQAAPVSDEEDAKILEEERRKYEEDNQKDV